METVTIEAIQNMTPKQLRDLRAAQGSPTTSRNRATLVAACVKALMPRNANGHTAAPEVRNGEQSNDEAFPAGTPAPMPPPGRKGAARRNGQTARNANAPSGKRHAPTAKAPKRSPPKRSEKRAPVRKASAAGEKSARSEYTPESVSAMLGGYGKTMKHGMRGGKWDGKVATCTVLKSGFRLAMVDDKGGDNLGLFPTLREATLATGQSANCATFWHLKPYPKHAKK